MIGPADARALTDCIRGAGVAVFPADTVYGLACDADTPDAVRRLYAIKGRRPDKPAAVMFFDAELALAALPELEERTREALSRLLPGGVTVLLANPSRRYPLACGPDPGTLGVRVPRLEGALEPLAKLRRPVLQSSANRTGDPAPRRLADVPEQIRREADVVLDGGELPGIASTVLDLRNYERGDWSIVREGALGRDQIAVALS